MKVVKGVVKVIGIVATIASFIPGPWQPIAATIAAVASVVSVALEVVAPTKANVSARGSIADYRLDPQTGIPYMMGRTLYAGTCIKRETWGKDNVWQGFTSVYSLGPINSIDSFLADRAVVAFDAAGNALGAIADNMWFKSQLGLCPSPLLACPSPEGASYPGWSASRLLSGLAASHWVLRFNKDGEWFSNGPPVPAIIGTGVKVYDPRLDSTYPGGSGACRALQENTYVYSNRPALHALTYALGRWQNGKRRFGIGFPVSSIDVASFVSAANVEDANGWTISGVCFSTDGKWNTLKQIMECGAAQPITMGGKLTCVQSAPRVSVATITSADVVGKCSVVATQTQRDRINTGVPRIRSESHGWELVSLDPVNIPSYETADGRRKSREFEWAFVNQNNQGAQLTSYFLMNAREFGPIELTVKIRWIGLKVGDCVTVNIPEMNLNNQKCIVMARGFAVGTGAVTLTLRSETDAKHAASLAANGTAPPIPSLTYNPDAKPAAPAAGSWSIGTGALSSASGRVPSLRFTGAVDNDAAEFVEFSYRKVGDATWTSSSLLPPNTIRYDVSAVTPGVSYEGRVRYKGADKFSAYLVLAATTVDAAAAGTATIADSIVGQGALATQDGVNVTQIPSVTGNIIVDANLTDPSNFGGNASGGTPAPFIETSADASVAAMGLARAIEFSPTGAAANTTPYMWPAVSIPTAGGRVYRHQVKVRRNAGFNGDVRVGVTWLDRNLATVSSSEFSLYDNRSAPVGASITTDTGRGSIVAPSNAVFMKPYVRVAWGASAPAGGAWIGAWVFREMTLFGQDVTREDGTSLVTDSLAITSLGTSAAIAGQGALATLGQVNFGSGGRVYRDDGVTRITDLLAVTSLGTAAAFLNQGPWATEARTTASVWSQWPNLVFNGSLRLPNFIGWIPNASWSQQEGTAGEGPYFSTTANGTNVVYSDKFRLLAGQAFATQAEFLASNMTAGNVNIDVEFINAAGSSLGDTGARIVHTSGGWTRLKQEGTAPANTAYGRVRVYTNGVTFGGGGIAAVRRIKVNLSALDTPFTDEATTSVDRLTRAGGFARVGDGRNFNSNTNFGIQSLRSAPTVTDTWVAGTPNTVTINIGASSYQTDWGTTINLPSASLPGLTPNTKYYLYRVQPDPTTDGTNYGASTSLSNALAPGVSYLGFWTTRATSGAGGGGGGYGGQDCVAASSYVLLGGCGRIASHCEPGEDELTILDEETMDGVTSGPLEANHPGVNDRIRLVTESDIMLTLSINTPLTRKDRSIVWACHSLGSEVPVLDHGKFRWEKVKRIEVIGHGPVAHIHANQKTFAAGDVPGRYILTHNQIVYK